MKTLSKLLLLALIILLAGCVGHRAPGVPGGAGDQPPDGAIEPTVGPPLSDVDSHECLNASDGPITIWHLGANNTPNFTCAPKVIVSLEFSDAQSIAYDGNIIPLDEVYTLVDGLGQVYTKQELLDGLWPDTIGSTGKTEEKPVTEWRGEGFMGWRR